MSLVPRRLSHRLFLSHAVVVAVGAAVMLTVGTVVTRTVYQHEVRGFGEGRGQRRQQVSESELTEALDASLRPALLAATVASMIVAVVVAWLISRRVLRPLDDVRAATRQMAAGDYSVVVDPPRETELASLADDVNTLGAHLADIERRRSQLRGEVTHEMRTPLTVIGGHLEGLIDGVIEPSTETFATLADETKRLQRLVDDLTLLSRADEGTLSVDLEPIDLATVIGEVAQRLRPQFEHRRVELIEHPVPELPVSGDRQRLAQVLLNVVGNALEHTPSGGRVEISAGRSDTTWVDVVDTGEGLDPTQLEAVFERFYRAPSSTGRAGRGIGLTVARSLARAHGGDLRATSPGRGRGSTFRLTLPNR